MIERIKVDNNSGLAKYKQIVVSILNAINDGDLSVGDKLPSLNQLVSAFDLSQDTVLTAYKELKHRGIISSSIGKGYFVTRTDVLERHHIFVLFDNLTAYKEDLYSSMKETIGSKAILDVYFHHGNQKAFKTLIQNALENYTAYIIVPIISPATDKILNEIPKKKLYIIDQGIARYGKKYRSVCQNFEKDINEALNKSLEKIQSYNKIFFVHRDKRQQFKELEKGFVKFCKANSFDFELLNDVEEHELKKKELFILVEDKDLVTIIKQSKALQLKPGDDVGIISYNDSPFKEIIADGISTISTDFRGMGRSVIEMIFENKTRHIENPSKLIERQSF
jgi:DNA-binding transcriptional regulator YhcF (GntR family)